jgi:hypothetical protein
MATLSNFTITSPENSNILVYSNGSWINSTIASFFGTLDGRYALNTHNHNGTYMAVGDAYTKSQTYPAASLYTRAEIDNMIDNLPTGGGSSGGGTGTITGASNVGSGANVFHTTSGTTLQFKRLSSSDINLLTVAVSGNNVIFSPVLPTWTNLVSGNGKFSWNNLKDIPSSVTNPAGFDGVLGTNLKFTNIDNGILFNPSGFSDAGGVRYIGESGNAGEMEFWTSDDYSEDFVWNSYDVSTTGTGTHREWMRLTNYQLIVNSRVSLGSGADNTDSEGYYLGRDSSGVNLVSSTGVNILADQNSSTTTSNQYIKLKTTTSGKEVVLTRDVFTYDGNNVLTSGNLSDSGVLYNPKASSTELNNYETHPASFNTISRGQDIGTTSGWNHIIHMYHNDNNGYAAQISLSFGTTPTMKFRSASGTGYGSWRTVWTDANDGSGSGLNADLLDGYHASSFALRPNDHTGNNQEYSIVWENNGGTLYTSTAHLKYNPSLRRITAGRLLMTGVNGDLLTLDSTGHCNLVLDRASDSYDNNIVFKTGGNTRWRLWMGGGDDHIAFRHEASGTQPFVLYQSDMLLQGRRAFRFTATDSWLRINEDSAFSSGVYFGSSRVRTDGNLEVGNDGSSFLANTSSVSVNSYLRVNKIQGFGGYITMFAGELGSDAHTFVNDTYGSSNEGLHLGGESGVYCYSSNNNDTSGRQSVRVIAPDGATYINHLDVYKITSSNQVVARFRHPSQNANISIVSKNQDNGSFRFEANADGKDLRVQTAGTNGGYTTADGAVGTIAYFYRSGGMYVNGEVSSTDTKARSDIRVKKNLNRIDNALDKVGKLTGYSYDEINLKKRMASVIAQDVQEVLPEAVGEDRDGMLNVAPMALIGMLVNAVNELSEKVKELENG